MSRARTTRVASAGLAALTLAASLSLPLQTEANELTAGRAAVAPQAAGPTDFDAFVKEVGIDMTTLPAAIRRQWSGAPRVGLDDCGITGSRAGHDDGHDEAAPAK